MNIFIHHGSNLPTDLWIASRYLLSISFLLAPFFIGKRVEYKKVFFIYLAIFFLIFLSIFYWKIFPATFIDGKGLTQFKVYSEYIIALFFLGAGALVYYNKKVFDRRLFHLLMYSFLVSIVAELSFTDYVSPYGFANLVGHLFLLLSFYLIYLGIIETALIRPGRIFFRKLRESRQELKLKEEKLSKINEILEEKVKERTYALEKVNRALKVLSTGNHILIHTESEKELLKKVSRMIVDEGKYIISWVGYVQSKNDKCVAPVAESGIKKDSLEDMLNDVRNKSNYTGPSSVVLKTGKIFIRKYIDTDSNYSVWKKYVDKYGYKSSIAIPLKVKDEIFGVLSIYAKEPDAFDEEEVILLEELGNDLAFGISNLRMKRAKDISERRLAESYRHAGLINRKVSLLLDLDKQVKSQSRKDFSKYVLKIAMNIANSDLGLLYEFTESKDFHLVASVGTEDNVGEELINLKTDSLDFLKVLVKNQTRLEITSDRYDLGCLNIKGRIKCFLLLPVYKKKAQELKGVIFLGFIDNKNLSNQDLEFFDVFVRYASSALFNAKVLK